MSQKPSEMMADYEEKKRKEKKYYFLKLTTSFFKDKAVKKLRRLPGGDTYALITLEIFLEALEHDNRIYYDGIEDTFAKELALAIDESPDAVQIAVDFLLSCGWLVEESSDTYYTPKGAEMSGSITDRALRYRRQQEKDKTEKLPQDFRNASAQLPDGFRNIDIDTEIEREQEKGLSGKKQKRPLWELFPDAFTPLHPKASPSLEEVISFHQLIRSEHVDPAVFYETFASQDWTADGKDITDWQTLYMKLDIAARDNSGDRE